MTGCTFSGNVVGFNGGGMYNGDSSGPTTCRPTVKDCTFSGNTAGNRGGGLCNENNNKPIVTNCTFSGNTAGEGGGMCNLADEPAVTNCTFSDNNATYGGGMYNNGGNPIVTNCTFTGNTAGSGGGMYNYNGSNPAVTHCTFSANSASDGGGMYNYNGSPTVTNCTFSSNSAAVDGGGMYNEDASVPVVRNCTFSGNSSNGPFGGGMSNAYNTGAPIVTNSVFWGDTGGEIVYAGFTAVAPTVTYSDVQGGYPTGTNIITDDPKLGSLAYNGGPTKTHALSADSPAIDKGWTFDVSVISTDQRGVARPQGVSFDIGAYEYWEKQILTVTTIGNGSVAPSPLGVVVGTTGTCWGYDNETPVILTASEDARGVFVSWGGDASGTSLTTTVTMDDTKNV